MESKYIGDYLRFMKSPLHFFARQHINDYQNRFNVALGTLDEVKKNCSDVEKYVSVEYIIP